VSFSQNMYPDTKKTPTARGAVRTCFIFLGLNFLLFVVLHFNLFYPAARSAVSLFILFIFFPFSPWCESHRTCTSTRKTDTKNTPKPSTTRSAVRTCIIFLLFDFLVCLHALLCLPCESQRKCTPTRKRLELLVALSEPVFFWGVFFCCVFFLLCFCTWCGSHRTCTSTDESFRFHNKNFDEMRCKLDSTENPRSFEKYPTPP